MAQELVNGVVSVVAGEGGFETCPCGPNCD